MQDLVTVHGRGRSGSLISQKCFALVACSIRYLWSFVQHSGYRQQSLVPLPGRLLLAPTTPLCSRWPTGQPPSLHSRISMSAHPKHEQRFSRSAKILRHTVSSPVGNLWKQAHVVSSIRHEPAYQEQVHQQCCRPFRKRSLSTAALRECTHTVRHNQGGYDYVIVGAGSAGAVVAHRLVKDAGAKALLLQEGVF